jgi:uncharacterized protein YbaR (Trm112 family)/SAM-dependent methyltransferase
VLDRLAGILACPICRQSVQVDSERVICEACGRIFPIRQGVPWMRPQDALAPDLWPRDAARREGAPHDGVSSAIPQAPQDGGAWRRLAHRWPLASPVYKTRTDGNRIPDFIAQVRRSHPDALILNIGSGSTAYEGTINLDVAPFGQIDLLGDAMALPVLSGTLDALITQGVLEHVRRPLIAIGEMQRILKPGGLSYHEIPFVQGDHTSTDCPDFWRFTASGAEALFEGYEVLDRGVVVGPSSGLLWVLREYLAILLSFNSRLLYQVAGRVLSWLLFPLKYLDHLVAKSRFAAAIACAFYIVVRKPHTAETMRQGTRQESDTAWS